MVADFFSAFSSYKARKPEKLMLNFAVISDTHIDSRKERIIMLNRGLRDMEKAVTPNDVLVCVGDTTDHGYEEHWSIASNIFCAHKPAKNTFMVLGNHDRWAKKEERKFSEQFFDFSRQVSGRELDRLYFSDYFNGYCFIALAKDDDENGVSDEQLEWLSQQMEAASAYGKPIFVFMHESINISHGLPYTWERRWNDGNLPDELNSGIGKRSDKVEAILKKHKNVFFFSGHIHLGLTGKKEFKNFGYSSIETDGSLHRINVPCFIFPNHHGHINSPGIGFQLEVYDTEVLLRPRSYVTGVWRSGYNVAFPIEK